MYIVWTVCVWDSYRLKCDKCDITIIAFVLLSLFGIYCEVRYILKYDNPTKYKNNNFIHRSKELIPGIFISLGVIYTYVFLYLWLNIVPRRLTFSFQYKEVVVVFWHVLIGLVVCSWFVLVTQIHSRTGIALLVVWIDKASLVTCYPLKRKGKFGYII